MRSAVFLRVVFAKYMPQQKSLRKIINDPVYGFITIQHPLIFKILEHPFYQRLRRIHQMALAYLVYPGAVHTRLHHSLGAYHLMCNAISELRNKGIEITTEEEVAAQAAILLHDVGHAPFSHALENILMPGVHHEDMSKKMMEKMNEEWNGELDVAIRIFNNTYYKSFLHQLVSGQLDVDRMDYLTRDSFFTGVSEGVIGYDRIIKMLTVKDNELVVEEKGIYSVEKFLIARRQMYWQVYLHKTVLSAEKMLVNIIKRVRELHVKNVNVKTGSVLDYFLFNNEQDITSEMLQRYAFLDDSDVTFAVKKWSASDDVVLQRLCNGILNRKLLKCRLQVFEDNKAVEEQRKLVAAQLHLSEHDASYFVFGGEASNTLYIPKNENIRILFKNGEVKDISQVDNALIHETVSSPVKKFYICSLY